MKKLYFTDLIKALYMMKEFGVEFQTKHQSKFDGKHVFFRNLSNLWVDGVDCSDDSIRFLSLMHMEDNDITRANEKIYIAPESESIFIPEGGDLGIDSGGDACEFQDCGEWIAYNDFRSNNPKNQEVKIIMRDNKQFFTPEVEDENS